MKKRLLICIICICTIICCINAVAFAKDSESIVISYENNGKLDVEVLDKYNDLEKDAECKEEAEYVIKSGLMGGVSENMFAPDTTLTRAMIVTVLWRMEGCPVANYALSFEDVEKESWYTEAVRWAAATEIVNGYTEKQFAPSDLITREQLATIMWRYAKYKGVDVSVGENTNILSYDDIFSVNEYAIPAFQWTCGSGIMSGSTETTLAPGEYVSRIYFASVIYKYSLNVKKSPSATDVR